MANNPSSAVSSTVAVRMDSTERRGPRYRKSPSLPSVNSRESVTNFLARTLGVSPAQADKLRWIYPKQIAAVITALRDAGHLDAVAAIIAPIDAACAGMAPSDERTGFRNEAVAEGECDLAEQDYIFDPSPANRDRLLKASAREQLAQAVRDNGLRQARTADR